MRSLIHISFLSFSVFLLCISISVAVIYIPLGVDSMLKQDSLIGVVLAVEPIIIIFFSLYLPRLLRFQGVAFWVIFLFPFKFAASLLLSYTNVLAWAGAIALLAVVGSGYVILMQYWCNYIAGNKYKGAILGIFGTSVSAGLVVGPYMITQLDIIMPYLSFLSWLKLEDGNSLILFFSLISSIPLMLILSSAPKKQSENNISLMQCFKMSKGPMFAISMAGSNFFCCAGFLVLYGIDNQSETMAPVLFSAFILGALLLELPLATLSDRIDRRYMIVACSMISMTCVSYLPIAITDFTNAVVLLFIWGGFLGAIYSIALALVSERIPESALLQSSCTYSLMDNIGGFIGLILTGLLTGLLGSDALVYVLMATNLCYFAFALTRYRIV